MEVKARELGIIANEGSEAATRGQKIHEWLAGEEVSLEAQDLETAEFLHERANSQIRRIFPTQSVVEFVEERLWLKVGGKPVLSGRFDRVIRTGKVALIQDYKTGRRVPEPADINAQLKVLAVLLAINHPSLEEVYVQIISRNHGISEAVYGIEDLHKAYDEIRSVLVKLWSKSAELNVGVEQCRYCPATLVCPALNAVVKPAVEGARTLPEGKEAAELLDLIALAENLFEAARKHYVAVLEKEPAAIPGYELAPGVRRREITDWGQAVKRLVSVGVAPECLQNAAQWRLSEVEALLATTLSLKPREAQGRFNELLADLIEWKTGAPVLKRLKDASENGQ